MKFLPLQNGGGGVFVMLKGGAGTTSYEVVLTQ